MTRENGDGFKGINGGDQVDRTASIPSHLSLLITNDRDFLISPNGTQVKASDLAGKVIGLYFSANWYSPCRTFNKLLTKIYNELKQKFPTQFEVVFVSSDEDIDAFTTYFSTMPWLSIPFSDLNSKRELNKKFDIDGVPCLVILQPDREEESAVRDGVEFVYRFGAEGFPFSRQRLEELEAEEKERHDRQTLVKLLTNKDRDFLLGHPDPLPVNSLIGKTVGLYFSAQWCNPGVKFTSKLKPIYHRIKAALKQNKNDFEDFEIVFVSTDNNETGFNSHFETMPWPALPFGDPNINDLTKYFDIRGIPCLVIVGPDGKTVTKNGRNLVNLYKEDAYPFTSVKVELLEREMDEVAKNLPRTENHAGHRHELMLVSEGNGGGPFVCCDCEEQGSGWAYQCIECGYEVHLKCVRPVGQGPSISIS